MARYFCSKCRLLDDGPHKEIFHCDECKICLSGRADVYFHCPKCDACVATKFQDTHGCRDQIMHADCPICGEQFYDSAQAIVQAPCKHLIHEQCLSQSLKYSYKCPLCLASVCDTRAVFCEIDEYMRISRMPTEYRNKKALIFCNDCCQRSAAKYHFVYHRCGKRRDELLTTKLWINDLKTEYLEYLAKNAQELPTDLDQFPTSIHDYIDYYSSTYAQNRDALVEHRAREIFGERMSGAAFIPSSSELQKLEASVVEEERLLKQVQLRLGEMIEQANANIDAQSQQYEQAQQAAQTNSELALSVAELEEELQALGRQVDEKERREQDVVEQQSRELQSAHNELLRETSLRDETAREQARLEERVQRLAGDEKARRMTAEDSLEQQHVMERWLRSVAPVVGARVEGSTLVLTLGDSLGAMSNRRILAQFNELGRIEHVRSDDGRELPPQLNHDALMRLLRE
ncbi:hypothetical protein IW148_000760 [Coemansia sp. RSA 1199]|nr:hypothetical protein IW148_000760 [Coemansia sp. RSA 1199]